MLEKNREGIHKITKGKIFSNLCHLDLFFTITVMIWKWNPDKFDGSSTWFVH